MILCSTSSLWSSGLCFLLCNFLVHISLLLGSSPKHFPNRFEGSQLAMDVHICPCYLLRLSSNNLAFPDNGSWFRCPWSVIGFAMVICALRVLLQKNFPNPIHHTLLPSFLFFFSIDFIVVLSSWIFNINSCPSPWCWAQASHFFPCRQFSQDRWLNVSFHRHVWRCQ